MNKTATVIVHDEDGQLWAEVEEFPGCFASGRNEQELRESLEESLSLYLSEPGAKVVVETLAFGPSEGVDRVERRKILVPC